MICTTTAARTKSLLQAEMSIDIEAEEFRSELNPYFKAGKYGLTIDCYSKAIALDANATYFENRAAAYMLLGIQ